MVLTGLGSYSVQACAGGVGHGGEHHVPLQDDHRSKDAKSNLRWTTSRGTAGEQDPQHDDQFRDA